MNVVSFTFTGKFFSFTKGNIYEGSFQCKKISDVEKKHVIQLYSKGHSSLSATMSDHPDTSMDVGSPNISSNDLDEFQRQADSLHCRSNSLMKGVLHLCCWRCGIPFCP